MNELAIYKRLWFWVGVSVGYMLGFTVGALVFRVLWIK